jgi:hypothetical protein
MAVVFAASANGVRSPDDVMAWQDRRYRFAHQVGRHLTAPTDPDVPAVADHVVYGVCVTGGGLIYVGQTADARRRLRDLPVGESHHLSHDSASRDLGTSPRRPVARPPGPHPRPGSTNGSSARPRDLRAGHRAPAADHLPASPDNAPQKHHRKLDTTPHRHQPLTRRASQHPATRPIPRGPRGMGNPRPHHTTPRPGHLIHPSRPRRLPRRPHKPSLSTEPAHSSGTAA